MSETSKRLHSSSSDSSPIASLPAKRITMDEVLCSVCHQSTGISSEKYEGFDFGPLSVVCPECSAKASKFDAVFADLTDMKRKVSQMELKLAQLDMTNQKVVELERKLTSDDDRVARIVTLVLDSMTTRFEAKLDNLDRKLDQKLDDFETKSRDADAHQKNKRCLVVTGMPEREGTVPDALTKLLNESFLPELLVADRFSVVHSYRMGKPRNDGSPRLIKLIFDSEIARDIVKSSASNLKNSTVFKGVRIRPSLSPTQQDKKNKLEEFRRATYPAGIDGRSPVGFRFETDGTAYLWNFLKKERVDVDLSAPPRAISSQPF